MRRMPLGALIYATGVVIGLISTDASPARRVAVALAWPLGPLAAIVTIAGLMAASLVLFPAVGIAAAVIAGLWLILG